MIDEALLTGESKPIYKDLQSLVFMGSTNIDGSLNVRITQSGENSYLSQVINLVKKLQSSRSHTQDLANHAAKWLFYAALAIGAETDIAIESADIILTKSDLMNVVDAITLSKQTYRKMLQNIWWASGYNIIAIPLATGVLAKWSILIDPAIGAILMSASTVIVAINAQLLKNIKPQQRKQTEHHARSHNQKKKEK